MITRNVFYLWDLQLFFNKKNTANRVTTEY